MPHRDLHRKNGRREIFPWLEAVYGEEKMNCEFNGKAKEATVKMNGCFYDLHAETKITADEFKGYFNITCPAGKTITIVSGTCEIQIGEQTKMSPVKYLNITNTPTEKNDIRVNPEISKSFKYKKTVDGIGCPLAGTGELGDGTFEGVTTVLGENETTLARHEIWFE